MEYLSLSWDSVELQKVNNSLDCMGILSSIDNICIVRKWTRVGTRETRSRNLLQFMSPIEFTWSRDSNSCVENCQIAFEKLQVAILSEDWPFLYHFLQHDYHLVDFSLDDKLSLLSLPCCQLEWKHCNVHYGTVLEFITFSSLSLHLDEQCFVVLECSGNQQQQQQHLEEDSFQGIEVQRNEQAYEATISLQSMYVDIYPLLKCLERCSQLLLGAELNNDFLPQRKTTNSTSHSLDWICGYVVVIEKLHICCSYPAIFPYYHLLLEKIRFTFSHKKDVAWKLVVFSVTLKRDTNKDEELDRLSSSSFTMISSRRSKQAEALLHCMIPCMDIQLTMEDVESFMALGVYVLQIYKPWKSNHTSNNQDNLSKHSPISSFRVELKQLHFHGILCGQEELDIICRQVSGEYRDASMLDPLQDETLWHSSKNEEYSLDKRFWFQLPWWSIETKDSSHVLFSFESQSVFYHSLVIRPSELLLEIASWKIHVDSCFLSTLASMICWWKQQVAFITAWGDDQEPTNDRSSPPLIHSTTIFRFILHYISISLTSSCCCCCHSNDTKQKCLWEIRRWMMEYRRPKEEEIKEEYLMYFREILCTMESGPSIWQHSSNGKSLMLSIVPGVNELDTCKKDQGIQLAYHHRQEQWKCTVALKTIQLQWNLPMFQLCLDFQKSALNMMQRIQQLSGFPSPKNPQLRSQTDCSVNIQISTIRGCCWECSDSQTSPLLVLQATWKHLKIVSSLSDILVMVDVTCRQWKMDLESIAIEEAVQGFLCQGNGANRNNSNNNNNNSSSNSLASDYYYSDRSTSSSYYYGYPTSKRHSHSMFKLENISVQCALRQPPSLAVRIGKLAVYFSFQRWKLVERWLNSWLPPSRNSNQPPQLVIPRIQLSLMQAQFIGIDEDEYQGFPLCRVGISSGHLQCHSDGGRLDLRIYVEIYNPTHLALEPLIEEWNTCLHFSIQRDKPPSHGLAYFASHLSLSYEDIYFDSGKLQVNLNPPMIATIYRLWSLFLRHWPMNSAGHSSLFSISNTTGDIVELYKDSDHHMLLQQIQDGQTVPLVVEQQLQLLLPQRHFYLFCGPASLFVRIDLALDGTGKRCFPVIKDKEGYENDIFLVVEKHVSGLHTLLEIRSNYFLQNDCDRPLWLWISNQEMCLSSGEKRNIPLRYLCNADSVIRWSFDVSSESYSSASLSLGEWLNDCLHLPDYLVELKGNEEESAFIYCVVQGRTEWNIRHKDDDVVIQLKPLQCIKNYLGIDIYVKGDNSLLCLEEEWSCVAHKGRYWSYSMKPDDDSCYCCCCCIRWTYLDEIYEMTVEWNNKKRNYQSRCKLVNREGRNSSPNSYCPLSFTVVDAPSTSCAWKEWIFHPDVVVSVPSWPIQDPNIALYWQWIPSSNVWSLTTNDSSDRFILQDSTSLPFATGGKVSQLEFRCIVQHGEHSYYSASQPCRKGKYTMRWKCKDRFSNEDKDDACNLDWDRSILVVVSYEKWIQQEDIVIPYVRVVFKYWLENASSLTWKLEWHDKCDILEPGKSMILSEAMIHSTVFLLPISNENREEEEERIELQLAQVRERISKGYSSIFALCGYPFSMQIQHCNNRMQQEHFQIICVDCPPTSIRFVNLSNSLFRIGIGKNSVSYGQHGEYLLGSGQTISMQHSVLLLLMDKHPIYFYVVQSGKHRLLYCWQVHLTVGFLARKERWIFYCIRRGPCWDILILEQQKGEKNTLAKRALWSSCTRYSRATFFVKDIGIALFAMNNDEIAYVCGRKIRLQCNWTQDWYLWLSFAVQDIHIDNQVTTVGRNYVVLMEKARVNPRHDDEDMIRAQVRMWWKKMWTALGNNSRGLVASWNVVDQLDCHIQPCAIRVDSDILESIIWWWTQTLEWTQYYDSYQEEPKQSSYRIHTLTFVEEFQVSDISCNLSFQFGRNGWMGLFRLPWDASSRSPMKKWEKWIALFGLSIGNIEDAPLLVRRIALDHMEWSSLVRDTSIFYKRDILWGIYAFLGSLNWFGNPNKCWKRIRLAWTQFFQSFLHQPKDIPLVLWKEWIKLQCRMLSSWIESSMGIVRGTLDAVSSAMAYFSVDSWNKSGERVSTSWFLRSIGYAWWRTSQRTLIGMLYGMERFQSWLSRWDVVVAGSGSYEIERWRPIRLSIDCQPLQVFQYRDDVLGNWIWEHWNDVLLGATGRGRCLGNEKLVLFASLEDHLGMLWTNYRFILCWYSVSIWRGGTKASLEHLLLLPRPGVVVVWELWHDQVLRIEKTDRYCIAFTWLPRISSSYLWNVGLSKSLTDMGMIQVHQVTCHDEELANWWLLQLETGFQQKHLVSYSVFHRNGHTFPSLSGQVYTSSHNQGISSWLES